MAKITRAQTLASEKEFGKEPKGIDFNGKSISAELSAYNYYNYASDHKVAKNILSKHYKDVDWDLTRALDFKPAYAWMHRLEENECILTDEMKAKRSEYVAQMRKAYPKKKVKANVEPTVAPTKIVDTYPDKKHLADFDEIDDAFWKTFNVVEAIQKAKILIGNIGKTFATELSSRVKRLNAELDEIPKDKQLKEGYSSYNASNIRVAKKFYTTILEHIDYQSAIKRVIKPRKKKVVPAAKKVERLKYQQNSEQFKLVSVNPEKLIDAKVVWAFNTKSRDLSRMESAEGFDVKGSTLFNGSTVKTKKVRKPEFIKSFEGTRAKLDKDFAALKTNERDGNFRINKDTILLKVFT